MPFSGIMLSQVKMKWKRLFKARFLISTSFFQVVKNIISALGNLCRCTGYRPILDGFKTLCCKEPQTPSGCNGVGPKGKCCKAYDISATAQQITDVLFDESEFLPYDPTMDIIFPSELQAILLYLPYFILYLIKYFTA
jgi:hypothetical protein